MDISALEPTPSPPPTPVVAPSSEPKRPPLYMAPIGPPRTPVVVAPVPWKIAKKRGGKKQRRAGLVFPVARIHRYFRQTFNWNRPSSGAAVYMAAVLEYLTSEMLEMAGLQTKGARKLRITPRHIKIALKSDTELAELFRRTTIASGGV